MEEEWIKTELDVKKNIETVQRTVARSLLTIHGDKAFMLALLEMDDAHESKRGNWRKILEFMEEFNKEKDDEI